MDSWFPYRGIETLPSKSFIFEGEKSLEGKEHLKIGDSENCMGTHFIRICLEFV